MFRTRAIVLALGLAALATPTFAQGQGGQGGTSQVTVTNPATSPVPITVLNPATLPALTSSIDDPGRVAYQSASFVTSCVSPSTCQFSFPQVPKGHRLVIQHVTGELSFSGSTLQSIVAHLNGDNGSHFLTPVVPNVNSSFNSFFDQPVLSYVEAGDAPSFEALVFGSSTATFSGPQQANLTGYLLDCTSAPCVPIAH